MSGGPFVARYDLDGDAVWASIFDDGAESGATSVGLLPDGAPVVCGYVLGELDLGLGQPLTSESGAAFIARFAP